MADYKGIRKANILARIDENPELTDSELRDYKGLAHFYVHILLLFGRLYGRCQFCLTNLLTQILLLKKPLMSDQL